MAVDSSLLSSSLETDSRGSSRAHCFLGLQSPRSELPLGLSLQYFVVRFVSSESPFDDARSLYRLLQLSPLQHSVGCTQPSPQLGSATLTGIRYPQYLNQQDLPGE